MKLDRALQKDLLVRLSAHYAGLRVRVITKDMPTDEAERIAANLAYLEEHGLVIAGIQRAMSGELIHAAGAAITAAGMDFLADDGGLTAILGTVTVKLHDDTIRELIAARIQDSDLPAEEKTGLLHQLKELRGESIKHLTMKLLDAGLENAPKAIPLIQSVLEALAR